ncbi:MAG: hypothetical protein II820_09045 [Ruminiclostridium sp.]|nr:hypothetical protein [Ruminiclostridium sp.]
MNFKKIIAVIAASAAAVATLAVSATAYDINKDLKTGWSASTVIPGEEFEGTDENTVFTITFEADASLAEKDGHNYWCIKPMLNDTGWPFIDTLVGPTLSDGKDSYVIQPEETEIKFTIPAAKLEEIQVAGMALMGHGIKLGTFSYSNSETVAPAAEAAPAVEEAAPAASDVQAETVAAPAKSDNPRTGVTDIVVYGTVMIAAGAVAVASRKRK